MYIKVKHLQKKMNICLLVYLTDIESDINYYKMGECSNIGYSIHIQLIKRFFRIFINSEYNLYIIDYLYFK